MEADIAVLVTIIDKSNAATSFCVLDKDALLS